MTTIRHLFGCLARVLDLPPVAIAWRPRQLREAGLLPLGGSVLGAL